MCVVLCVCVWMPGRGGSKIKEIQEESHCDLEVCFIILPTFLFTAKRRFTYTYVCTLMVCILLNVWFSMHI